MRYRRAIVVFLRCQALFALVAALLCPAQPAAARPQTTITVTGRWKYPDRSTVAVPANTFLVELLSGSGEHLAWGYTDSNGYFSLGPLAYSPWMQIKVKIRTYTDYGDGALLIAPEGGTDWSDAYNWETPTHTPPPNRPEETYSVGTITIQGSDSTDTTPWACWLLDDLQRGFHFLRSRTTPGSFTIEWPAVGESRFETPSGRIFVSLNDALSRSALLHEMGHKIMYNVYGFRPNAQCPDPHLIDQATNPVCAWTEGWASFWAMAANDDPNFYLVNGVWNLEVWTWGDTKPIGDQVEGRAAAALWDLIDAANDGYDTYDGTFDDVWAVFVNSHPQTLAEFWAAWKIRWPQSTRTHYGVLCTYQNTIDYDNRPVIVSLPEVTLDMNTTSEDAVNLWSYTNDVESPDGMLAYAASDPTNPNCGVSIDPAGYVDVRPTANWAGSCTVRITAHDSIYPGWEWLTVTVVDNAKPSKPGNLRSPSTRSNGWTPAAVTMAWNPATDVGGGVDGYSFAWDSCTPDQVKDVEEGVTTASEQISTSGAHNFSVRAVDTWGNWGNPACAQVNVDADRPSSSVAPLPGEQTHNWWVVGWSGSDGHSGVAHYDVQYQAAPGGPWTNWLVDTTSMQGLFTHATPGQSYSFRCRAVDRVGNVEDWPALGAGAGTRAGADTSGLTELRLPIVRKNY